MTVVRRLGYTIKATLGRASDSPPASESSDSGHRPDIWWGSILAWLPAILLVSLAVLLVGENPLRVFGILAASAAGSAENVAYTLFYATPLLLTGTAVAVALEAGLFNIGAEGQLYMGALAAAVWGALTRGWFPADPAPHAAWLSGMGAFAVVGLGAVVSFAGGALWGGLAGYLRARRQTHEVIATIMLNFVALAVVNWAILNPMKNPETQSPETVWIAPALRVPAIWSHVTIGLPMALVLAAAATWAMRRTWWGFRVRATGRNAEAARLALVPVGSTMIGAMALSGGIAGLVGFHEVFFHSYRLIDSFSMGAGFTGLVVALLSRGSFAALVGASLLLGALHKGALDLDLETEKVTRDLSAVIQALILASLAARPGISAWASRRRAR